MLHVHRLAGDNSHQDRQDQRIDHRNAVEHVVPFLPVRGNPVKKEEIIQYNDCSRKQKGMLVTGFSELNRDHLRECGNLVHKDSFPPVISRNTSSRLSPCDSRSARVPW